MGKFLTERCPLFGMLCLFTNSGELQIFCCCVFSLPLSFPCPTFVTPVPAIVHIAHGGGSPPPQITREPQFGLSGKCKKAPRMRHKSGRQLPIRSWQQFMARNCGWLAGCNPPVCQHRVTPLNLGFLFPNPDPDPQFNSGIRILGVISTSTCVSKLHGFLITTRILISDLNIKFMN